MIKTASAVIALTFATFSVKLDSLGHRAVAGGWHEWMAEARMPRFEAELITKTFQRDVRRRGHDGGF
jgi:hypothetical protein